MSPRKFSITSTSKCPGSCTSRAAAASAYMYSSSTSGNSSADAPHALAEEREAAQHVRLVDAGDAPAAIGRARPPRCRAMAKARRATRSTPFRVMTMVSSVTSSVTKPRPREA